MRVAASRRRFLAGASAVCVGGLGFLDRRASAQAPQRPPLVFDAMAEIRTVYTPELIRRILASGTGAVTITLTDPKLYGDESYHALIADLAAYERYFDSHPDLFVKARRVADVDRARAEGKLAIFYLIQNSAPIEKQLERLDVLYGLGLRSVQVTYNDRNYAGDGCFETSDGGLSAFGAELVARMNERGMLVDLSHAGMRTMADAIAASRKPVVISHTACRTLREHRRNTSDANLRALAQKGGVVGLAQIRTFLTDAKRDNLNVYFEHIDHAVKTAGIDHVAIGSDRDHRVIPDTEEEIKILLQEEGVQFRPDDWPLYLEKLNGPHRMQVVRDGLVQRGYSQDQIDKIMGANLYRLYREVVG